jgi:hypothetical protein
MQAVESQRDTIDPQLAMGADQAWIPYHTSNPNSTTNQMAL